jgi:hypothetical protein
MAGRADAVTQGPARYARVVVSGLLVAAGAFLDAAVNVSSAMAQGPAALPTAPIGPTRPVPPNTQAADATPVPAAPPGSSAPARVSPPPRRPASPAPTPRAYLIHLIDGSDPIVVKRYVEEEGQIRFEKFGGWVGIPRYEVLKIVPDLPEASSSVPLPPVPPEPPPGTAVAGTPGAGPTAADQLYLTTRDGASLQALSVVAEGDRLRVQVTDGSFTLARTDVVGIVRIPRSPAGYPEAWLTVLASEATGGLAGGPAEPARGGDAAGVGTQAGAQAGAQGSPRFTAPPVMARSEGPHLLRLANGQLLRIEGFWIEGREIRFRRLGGMVGLALDEVARLIPEDLAPVNGRTAVRYATQLGPDLVEVRVRSGPQRVRLIGVQPLPDVQIADDPWHTLTPGIVVYLEFDRQRYDRAGDWLAYLFLPNGRMLNAELIRSGLARPRPENRNLRYLDLFQELAGVLPPAP